MGIRKLCETKQKKRQRVKLQCWYLLHSPSFLLMLHLALSSPHTHPSPCRCKTVPFFLTPTDRDDQLRLYSPSRPLVKAIEETVERGNHFVLEAWLS